MGLCRSEAKQTVLLVLLMVATACSSTTADDTAAPTTLRLAPTTSQPPASSPSTSPAPEVPLPAEPTVELLGWEPETPAMWWPVLRTFGLGGAPGVSPWAEALPQFELPDGVERFDLGMAWGIDSTANLVLLTGEHANAPVVVAQLEAASDWVATGDGWSAVAGRNGHSASYEMRGLMRIVSWMADPVTACDDDDACPAGADYGFPSPPPTLLTNGEPPASTDVPFGWEMVPADRPPIDTTDPAGPIYAVDGVVGGAGFELSGEATGPVLSHFGVLLAIDADRGAIQSSRRWEPRADSVSWTIPDGWVIDGLAVVRSGSDVAALVVTGTFAGEHQTRALELHLDGLNGQDTYRASTDLADSVVVSPPGSAWSLPKSFFFSDLHVVDRRADGWYLVRVTDDGPVDLLRTDAPIIDYAFDAAERHLALAVEGAAGVSNWWAYGDQVEELPGAATALAWTGTYRAPMYE